MQYMVSIKCLEFLLLANKAGDTFTLCDVIADASEAAQKNKWAF